MSEQNSSLKRKHDGELLDDQNEKNLELDQSYVTMVDVLNDEEKLEDEVYAVLGASDDKNCTYEQGYLNRQALYSCRTCMSNNTSEENGDVIGICLACSYACHQDHDLVELYTKRTFRCDCGNSKMKGNCCSLFAAKDSLNEKNKYNHNFKGNYCLCDQPYPNLEGKDEEMVQCIICEDWYHENCLGCHFPDDNDYSEMICKKCMSDNEFLSYYQTEKIKIKSADTNTVVDEIKSEEVKTDEITTTNTEQKVSENGESNAESATKKEEITNDQTNAEKKEEEIKVNENVAENECKLKVLKSKLNIESKQATTTFWDENWRSQLCKCDECLKLYAEKNLEFLIDETDTVHYYEAKGKEKCQKLSQYEQGLNEISKISHVAGIEAIMEFQSMSAEFKEHFKKFAEDKKVIEQKDIEEFFATLKYKKRMKLDHSF